MKRSLLLYFFVTSLLAVSCSKQGEEENKGLAKRVIEKHEDGSPTRVGYTINGKRTGEWRLFLRNRLAGVINFKDGLTHGKETWYNRCSGRIIEEGYNDMGKPVGLWYNYDEGELIVIVEYKGDSSEFVYHNPKFRDATGVPPPPKRNSTEHCESH